MKTFSLALTFALLVTVPSAAAEEKQKVVIPFDFVSKFDDGRYGQMVGEDDRHKIQRQGGFVIPESMLEVRDTCQQNDVQPSPEMSLERMKEVVRKDFDAQIGIWGSVERVAGHEGDVYDLVIKCVDFSAPGGPKTIYDRSVRTNSVSEIPHLYVKEMLDALYDRKPGGPAVVDPAVEKNWKENPNLVVGGDFQSGSGGVPRGWEPVAGQLREPLGNLVRWAAEEGKPSNKLIRFVFPGIVGDNEGVMYYSKPFRVEEGSKYRFQCRYRTNGPAVKVFIKCYDEVGTTYQPEGGYKASTQLREVYRSQQNLKGPKNVWNTQTEDFTPAAHEVHAPLGPRDALWIPRRGRGRVRRRGGEADRAGFRQHQRQQEESPLDGIEDYDRGDGGERTPREGVVSARSPLFRLPSFLLRKANRDAMRNLPSRRLTLSDVTAFTMVRRLIVAAAAGFACVSSVLAEEGDKELPSARAR